MIQLVFITPVNTDNNNDLNEESLKQITDLKSNKIFNDIEVMYTSTKSECLQSAVALTNTMEIEVIPDFNLDSVDDFSSAIESIVYKEFREDNIATIAIVADKQVIADYLKIKTNVAEYYVMIYETGTIIK